VLAAELRAPEQFSSGQGITNKVDIWAFASTVLHMLTGCAPWQDDTMLQICTAVGVGLQAPPLPPGLPAHLELLLSSCLQSDPAKRPTAAHILKVTRHMARLHAD